MAGKNVSTSYWVCAAPKSWSKYTTPRDEFFYVHLLVRLNYEENKVFQDGVEMHTHEIHCSHTGVPIDDTIHGIILTLQINSMN